MIFDSHKSIRQYARRTARAEARSTAGLCSIQLINWKRSLLDLIIGLRRPSRSFSNAKLLLTGLMGRTFLTVPTHLCSHPFAFNYSLKHGWNPFVDLVVQLRELPNIKLEETRFFQFFCQLHALHMTDVLSFHDPNLRKSLPPIPFGSYPWGTFDAKIPVNPACFYHRSKNPHLPGNIWCDTDSRFTGALEREFHKYSNLLQSFQKHGYRPYLSKTICPRATILIAEDGQARFIIREGMHRFAVLSAFGCSHVLIHLDLVRFPPVLESDASSWPYVRFRLLTPGQAKEIFGLYFQLNGQERASAVGLDVTSARTVLQAYSSFDLSEHVESVGSANTS